jgi:hypothetical protein
MQLWQLDIMGSVMLTDPTTAGGMREVKLISGIDDHSRYCVIATIAERGTSRAVCTAFLAALARYGIPEQVLTDNGVQFTGKYLRPRPTEVLFDQICRHNGIDHLLTKIRSPTTTGKIERWHQSIQTELLDDHGPFDSVAAAQAAVDGWVADYNHTRPHQARDMDPPAQHFTPIPAVEREALTPWTPPELTGVPDTPPDVALDDVAPDAALEIPDLEADRAPSSPASTDAVEIERIVPASGNLGICGQQFWLGTQRAGQTVTLRIDTTTVHLGIDGTHLKTLPSRMTTSHLARLRAAGARPAGPAPARPAAGLLSGPVEIHRTVNASGNVSVAGHYLNVGAQHAGRRITVRLDTDLAHVIVDGALTRTTPLALPPTQRARLQGAQTAGSPPSPDQRPARTQRRVSARGDTQVIGQRVPVGLRHAGRIVTIEIGDTVLRVFDERGDTLINQTPRTSTKTLARFKAYGVNRNRTTG